MHTEVDGVSCPCSCGVSGAELNPRMATVLPATANPANAAAWRRGPARQAAAAPTARAPWRAPFVPAQWTVRGGERTLAPDFSGDGLGAYLVAPSGDGWPFTLEPGMRSAIAAPASRHAEMPGGFTVAVAPAAGPTFIPAAPDARIAPALWQRIKPGVPQRRGQSIPSNFSLQGGHHHHGHHGGHGRGFAFGQGWGGGPWWDASPAVIAVEDDCPAWCYANKGDRPCPSKCYARELPPTVLGLAGPFDGVLNALGLRNPLSAIEPELYNAGELDRIWGKYDDLINRYSAEVGSLQSSGIRAELLGKLGELGRLRDKLRPFFPSGGAPGVVVGEKEKSELGDLVQGVDDFRRTYSAARKKYGLLPPAPDAPIAPVPASMPPPIPTGYAADAGGIPTWAWIVGGVAAAALAAAAAR